MVSGHSGLIVEIVEVVAGYRRHANHCCVAGAALHELLDERHAGPLGCLFVNLLGDPFGTMAHHHNGAIDIDRFECVDDVHHHASAANEVQRLGSGRTHAGAFAGGEHDGRNGHDHVLAHAAARRMRMHCSGERARTPINGIKTRCPTIERPRKGFAIRYRAAPSGC